MARQVQKGQEHYRGASAHREASSPPQRHVRNHSAAGVRDSAAERAPPRPTEVTLQRGTPSPARSPPVRSALPERSMRRTSEQRRYVKYGEQSITYGRPGNPRQVKVVRRSPSAEDVENGTQYTDSPFEVCMIQQSVFGFCIRMTSK